MQYKWLPVFLCCIFLMQAAVTAQPVQKKDSLYVFSLIDKAEAFFTNARYDSALHYCGQAELYSRQKNYKKGTAYALIEKTDILIDKDDLPAAEQVTYNTAVIGQQINDSLISAIATMQQAQVKMYADKTPEALQLFEKCLKYFSRHPSKYAALAYNDYGYTLGGNGELDKQAANQIRALQIYEQVDPANYGQIAVTLNNISTVYYEMGDKPKAIEYAKKSIVYREKTGDISKLSLSCCNISQLYLGIDKNEALRYQQLCVKYAEQSGDVMRIIHSYITSSLVANSEKDYPKSAEFEKKIVAILERTGKDPAMLARRYISLGILSNNLKEDTAVTISWYNKAEKISAAQNDKYNLRDVYLYLSLFYKANMDFGKAYDYYRKHILYRDSIMSSNTAKNVAELEKKYETEKKDNEITQLNADKRIKALQIEKQNALIAGNLLEAKKKESEIELLSKAKELQELRISQQDEELEKQLLQAKTNEQQLQLEKKEKQLQERKLKNAETVRNFILAGIALLALLAYFLFNRYQLKRKIQEQAGLLAVRNNIAQDLHDEIGSTLTSIKILSEVSEKNLQKDQHKASTYLQKITEQSSAAQQGISDIVWAVKPENDRLENLVIRMREYASHTLESKDVAAFISIDEKLLHQTLDMAQRRDLLLIFREAVNNIAKYAKATTVEIQLSKKDNHLQLLIRDNGIGFDVSKQSSSSGLKNMQSRAKVLNGSLRIVSVPGEGTCITLLIPTH
ncbi:MAG: tetratricopeptide repeat protein [Ferruginibacter sp.]